MNKKILYFGNKYLEEDNLAVKVCEKLKNLDEFKETDFFHVENSFQLVDLEFDNLIIIDVVQGIKEVQEIKFEDLKQNNLLSLHDFDLGFFLKLRGKSDVKIIGIPQEMKEEEALESVKKKL